MNNKFYYTIIVFFTFIYLLPSYIILSPDNECFYSTIVSTMLQANAVKEGFYPFWTSLLGFGMPQPFSSSFYFHPFFLLFAYLPPEIVIAIFFQFHLLLGAFSVWFLCKKVNIRSLVALICVLTYVLSAPTLNYLLTDFWLDIFVMWSILPLAFLIMIKFLTAQKRIDKLRYSLFFALISGLMILNGHLGVAIPYFAGILFYMLGWSKEVFHRWKWLLLIFVLIIAMTASKTFHIYSEYIKMAKDVPRLSYAFNVFSKEMLWELFVKPLFFKNWGDYLRLNLLHGTRIVWFGSVFTGLAVISIFFKGVNKKYRNSFFVSGLLCFFCIAIPSKWSMQIIGSSMAFRDTLVISGIILAGITISAIIGRFKKAAIRRVCYLLLSLQLLMMIAGAFPFWLKNLSTVFDYYNFGCIKGIPAYRSVLRSCFAKSELIKLIQSANLDKEGRIYYTQTVNSTIVDKNLKDLGFFYNSLAINNVRVVNGLFKGISYDRLHPADILMRSHIPSQDQIFKNKPLLDIAGIRYVIASGNEDPNPFLKPIYYYSISPDIAVKILINNDAWDDAVILKKEAKNIKLERLEASAHDRLLCADFSPVVSLRIPGDKISTVRKHGKIYLKMKPSLDTRTLLINEYFRPEWVALVNSAEKSSLKLKTFAIFEEFIGIDVPPGVTGIVLTYYPLYRIILEIISWVVVVSIIIILSVLHLKYKSRMSTQKINA